MSLSLFGFICGAIGNLAFGFKSAFQVKKIYKTKSVEGISPFMLLFDFIGNILCSIYIYLGSGFQVWFQFVNYGFATFFLIWLAYLIFKYKKKPAAINNVCNGQETN